MTIVDSSSWIEALRERGLPEVRARVASLLDAGDAAWCEVVRLELWRGARNGAERKALRFLESRVPALEIDAPVWETAVRLMIGSRSKGLTAPVTDVVIVATAHRHQVALEHCDAHLAELLEIIQETERA